MSFLLRARVVPKMMRLVAPPVYQRPSFVRQMMTAVPKTSENEQFSGLLKFVFEQRRELEELQKKVEELEQKNDALEARVEEAEEASSGRGGGDIEEKLDELESKLEEVKDLVEEIRNQLG
jgi:predicted RNase H-like nuclease (RuvC/YqgF family)